MGSACLWLTHGRYDRGELPEFSVVFRFRAYSRRHETEPESISPQDVLRPGGRRARWLLRDGAVQRQSAVQRVAKIGIFSKCSPGLFGFTPATKQFFPFAYSMHDFV